MRRPLNFDGLILLLRRGSAFGSCPGVHLHGAASASAGSRLESDASANAFFAIPRAQVEVSTRSGGLSEFPRRRNVVSSSNGDVAARMCVPLGRRVPSGNLDVTATCIL